MAPAQEATSMAAQESGKAHLSELGWPTDSAMQAEAWISGVCSPGAWVGHSSNQPAWQQAYWMVWNTLPE